MDKLAAMRVFATVANTQSFTATAKELGMSRAMVTKHVIKLENNLGIRLLNRTTRRLNLTEAGTVYLGRCTEILQDIEEAELEATQLHGEARGTLKVGAPPSFGAYHIACAIPDYIAVHPNVKVDLSLHDGPIGPVEEGLDLAIVVGQLEDSSVISRKLTTTRMVVCASPGYLELKGHPKYPGDLKTHNCLINKSLAPRDRWPFRGPDGPTVVRVQGSMEANVADALRVAAVNGLGITALPIYMVGEDLKEQRLREVLTEYETTDADIFAVYPHRKHLSAKVRTFVDFLMDRLQPTPYWER